MKSIRARCSRKKPPGSQRKVVFAPDVVLVGADQVAFHGPGADQAVQAPQRGIGLREIRVIGHDGCLLCVLFRPFELGSGWSVRSLSLCSRKDSHGGAAGLGTIKIACPTKPTAHSSSGPLALLSCHPTPTTTGEHQAQLVVVRLLCGITR